MMKNIVQIININIIEAPILQLNIYYILILCHTLLVSSLHQEDPLEEGMATHSIILAWRIPWTEEPGGYSPWANKESDRTKHTHTGYNKGT